MSGSDELVGKRGTAKTIVGNNNTAKAVGSGSLEVFATPMLAALMEQAACAALDGMLQAGQTSVGVKIAVEHTAASPLGTAVSASAVVASVCGREITFELAASDEAGGIGKGMHTRVIVDQERFLKKVNVK